MDVASDGDDGFEAFVIARWSPMVTTAFLVTADRGIAEDCVQDALVGLYRRWRRVHPEGRVAYANRAVDQRGTVVAPPAPPHRGAAQRRGPCAGAAGTGPGGLRPAAAGGPLVAAAAGPRDVVVLRFLEDRSEAETAEVLGCSVGT